MGMIGQFSMIRFQDLFLQNITVSYIANLAFGSNDLGSGTDGGIFINDLILFTQEPARYLVGAESEVLV